MKITLINPSAVQRKEEPISIGVPCPRGTVQPDSSFVLKSRKGTFPIQSTPLIVWPDQSVKWLLCDFLIDLEPNEQSTYIIEPVSTTESSRSITYKYLENTIEINTGIVEFSLDTAMLLPFRAIRVNGLNLLDPKSGPIRLRDQFDEVFQADIDEIIFETKGPVRLTIHVAGHFGAGREICFQARLNFYAGSAKTSIEFTLHNSEAAKHPGGIWDLGDPSSFFFKELVVPLTLGEVAEKFYKLNENEPWLDCDENSELKIYQESSGGANWDSPNHRNYEGNVPMKIKGYQVLTDTAVIRQGYRCQPVVWMGSGEKGVSAVVPRFWQEFPTALGIGRRTIDISLFPACYPDLHELQGGEQKSHTVYLDFSVDRDQAGWGLTPVQVTIDPQTINESGIFKDITCGEPASRQYREFLNAALEGQSSFFAKREVVDEYGWRNFGELYADHEGVFHKEDKPFVSHYNNQYDPIASFYREFFHTGDSRWAELAGDLARHVRDIDINHTDLDREEYCHGLFWHTDHYLDAGLSTHRSVSAEHLTQKNPAFVGGGPGAEHCYSTGLMMHYLLTGDLRYRKTVIELADWCILSLKGPQTFLAALLRCKHSLTAWNNRSVGSVWPIFPLSRGTGNCINVCLDAFELTLEPRYLKESSKLIRGTVHPNDNVADRDLLNAEDCWSYSVFLVALIKFLEKKREINELDDDYLYARESLLKYVSWMVENEYPFLENTNILEYPNETWAAQDFRKSVIFYQASKYANHELRSVCIERCRFFLQRSFAELESWDTRFLSRPMVLVLQNGWVADTIDCDIPHYNDPSGQVIDWGEPKFDFKFSEVARRLLADFKEVLPNTNLHRELAWLKVRLK